MLRFNAVALSASLLFGGSFAARASSIEAEWAMSPSAETAVSVLAQARSEMSRVLPLEEQGDDLSAADAPFSEKDAVLVALAPEYFLDANEGDTCALIAADLASIVDATGSIDFTASLEMEHSSAVEREPPLTLQP
jgi:hypothetical protein